MSRKKRVLASEIGSFGEAGNRAFLLPGGGWALVSEDCAAWSAGAGRLRNRFRNRGPLPYPGNFWFFVSVRVAKSLSELHEGHPFCFGARKKAAGGPP